MSEQRDDTISVLLPVHAGIDPEHLLRALESIAQQTVPAAEVVLVEDGPLRSAHHDVVADASGRLPLVRVVLPVNQGAGVANQAGLLRCRSRWVAKADADDISLPERFARQVEHLSTSGADVCGTAMWEFRDAEEHVVSTRIPPIGHSEIARRMRWNNPMNHPSTMYDAERARSVGGYGDLRYMQDYDLFARLLADGARFVNLAEPLVLFRAGPSVYARRRSPAMRRCEWQLQHNLREYGVIGPVRMLGNFVARQGARSLPAPAMARLHGALFSSELSTSGPA